MVADVDNVDEMVGMSGVEDEGGVVDVDEMCVMPNTGPLRLARQIPVRMSGNWT